MLQAAVEYLVNGLSLKGLLTLKLEKFLILSGYTETKSIYNNIAMILSLETLVRNNASRSGSLEKSTVGFKQFQVV
jgi:hypothetical protein